MQTTLKNHSILSVNAEYQASIIVILGPSGIVFINVAQGFDNRQPHQSIFPAGRENSMEPDSALVQLVSPVHRTEISWHSEVEDGRPSNSSRRSVAELRIT
jgi:hypothetical protein